MHIAGYDIRAFCVTIQEMPERWEFISNHFKSVGIEAEPFNGVNSEISGLKTIHPYEVDVPGSGWKMEPKAVSTWVSFYMLWSAMQFMPDEYFWQLEWDCHFPDNWRERTEVALRDVPKDFDLLFIGSCCASFDSNKHIKGDIWDVRYPQCGHSLIIAKKALPILLSTQRKVYAPLDISIKFHSCPLLKVYTVLPRICDQFDTILPP